MCFCGPAPPADVDSRQKAVFRWPPTADRDAKRGQALLKPGLGTQSRFRERNRVMSRVRPRLAPAATRRAQRPASISGGERRRTASCAGAGLPAQPRPCGQGPHWGRRKRRALGPASTSGGERIRTVDPLLAKTCVSLLSCGFSSCYGHFRETVTRLCQLDVIDGVNRGP